MSKTQADLMLLLVTLTAAAGWLFSKTALTELPPFWFIGSRFLLAGFILSLFCLKALWQMSIIDITKGIFTGSLFAAAMMIWIQGLHQSPHIGEASFIVSLGVMFVPLFSFFILKEKIPLSLLLSLPIAIAGLATLNLQDGSNLRWEPAHLTLITAAILFALQFTITAKFARSIAPLPLTTLQLLTAGFIAFFTAQITEQAPTGISNTVLMNVIAAAILASSLRFLLQTQALKYSQASHAGMILLLEPIWVTLMGYAVYTQKLSHQQFLGCSLIFLALLINRLPYLKLKTGFIQLTQKYRL
ncbi:MAG: DMT family transporter [Pseudomonadales bacterium]|nr:DMT family transporter [Pseudomonadales bacterium]